MSVPFITVFTRLSLQLCITFTLPMLYRYRHTRVGGDNDPNPIGISRHDSKWREALRFNIMSLAYCTVKYVCREWQNDTVGHYPRVRVRLLPITRYMSFYHQCQK